MEAASPRTIDDYFEQLYQEWKKRLPLHTASGSGTPSSNIYREGLSSFCHYVPLPLLALCVANSSDATEILMLSYLLSDSTFRHDMFSNYSNGDDADDGSSMEGAEYFAASIFMGMLLGGTLFGFLSDHIGRRPALLAGLFINATAGSFSSIPFLTPTISHLTTWRFIAGVGVGATIPSLFSLASEWSPKEIRGAVVTCVASFWMVGSLFVSGLAWCLFKGGRDHSSFPIWRIFSAICSMPSGIGAWMVYYYIPESPRFLASSKQYDQSACVCNQMAKYIGIELVNDAHCCAESQSRTSDEDVDGASSDGPNTGNSNVSTHLLFVSANAIQPLAEEELQQRFTSTKTAPTDLADTGSTLKARLVRTIYTLIGTLQKLYSPQLLTRTTLPLQMIWFALSFATYGITTWINTLFFEVHLKNIYFNSFLFALANLPGNVMSILYSDKWGRKRMLVGSLLGAAAGLAGFAILVYCAGVANQKNGPSNARTYGIVFCACIFQMFSIISWNAIDILSGELFPTRVRSAGISVCTACGRFGGILAQFVNARLMMAGPIAGGGEGGAASTSVLVVASSTLLIGAAMPIFLETDMALGELKDEVTEENLNRRSVTLSCISKMKVHKDHLSDDEMDSV